MEMILISLMKSMAKMIQQYLKRKASNKDYIAYDTTGSDVVIYAIEGDNVVWGYNGEEERQNTEIQYGFYDDAISYVKLLEDEDLEAYFDTDRRRIWFRDCLRTNI